MNVIKQQYLKRKICLKNSCRAVNSVNSTRCVKCRSELRYRKIKRVSS